MKLVPVFGAPTCNIIFFMLLVRDGVQNKKFSKFFKLQMSLISTKGGYLGRSLNANRSCAEFMTPEHHTSGCDSQYENLFLKWKLVALGFGSLFQVRGAKRFKKHAKLFFIKYLVIPRHRLAKSGDAPSWGEFVIIYFLAFFFRLHEYDQNQNKTLPNCSRCLSDGYASRYGQWLSNLNFKLQFY